jgi:hypothetical protein
MQPARRASTSALAIGAECTRQALAGILVNECRFQWTTGSLFAKSCRMLSTSVFQGFWNLLLSGLPGVIGDDELKIILQGFFDNFVR